MKRLALALMLLTGCATSAHVWPAEGAARSYFEEKRSVFENLAARFDSDSKLNAIEHSTDTEVLVHRGDDYPWTTTRVKDPELVALLGEAHILQIRRHAEIVDFGELTVVSTHFGPPLLGWKEIEYRLSYYRTGLEHPAAYPPCPSELPPHYVGSFGHCAIHLDERWFIHYFWSSN